MGFHVLFGPIGTIRKLHFQDEMRQNYLFEHRESNLEKTIAQPDTPNWYNHHHQILGSLVSFSMEEWRFVMV